MLRYEHLLMVIGRCEEEKFALVLEIESSKNRIDELEKENDELKKNLKVSRELVKEITEKENGELVKPYSN